MTMMIVIMKNRSNNSSDTSNTDVLEGGPRRDLQARRGVPRGLPAAGATTSTTTTTTTA